MYKLICMCCELQRCLLIQSLFWKFWRVLASAVSTAPVHTLLALEVFTA